MVIVTSKWLLHDYQHKHLVPLFTILWGLRSLFRHVELFSRQYWILSTYIALIDHINVNWVLTTSLSVSKEHYCYECITVLRLCGGGKSLSLFLLINCRLGLNKSCRIKYMTYDIIHYIGDLWEQISQFITSLWHRTYLGQSSINCYNIGLVHCSRTTDWQCPKYQQLNM